MHSAQKRRRFTAVALLALAIITVLVYQEWSVAETAEDPMPETVLAARINRGEYTLALETLGKLAVRERIKQATYSRDHFSASWNTVDGCDMRNRILQRDLTDVVLDEDNCTVLTGVLEKGQFSGKHIPFERGTETSQAIHIEHIVALSDAWQKGAHNLSRQQRHDFYHDPLNLIAIDGPTNMEKGDKDASDWLPREAYRCRYIARQIAVKQRYNLWLTKQEHSAMQRKLQTCPLQVLPVQQDSRP